MKETKTSKESLWVKALSQSMHLSFRPDDLSWLPETCAKEEERTNSTQLSSDLHTRTRHKHSPHIQQHNNHATF